MQRFLDPEPRTDGLPDDHRWVLNKVNPGVGEAIKAGEHVSYNYTVPMLIFASLGVLAFLLAFWLKLEDRKKHYGLELPNIKK